MKLASLSPHRGQAVSEVAKLLAHSTCLADAEHFRPAFLMLTNSARWSHWLLHSTVFRVLRKTFILIHLVPSLCFRPNYVYFGW